MKKSIFSLFFKCLMIVTVITILPIIYASRYAHPLLDDYNSCIATRHAWIDTHSFIEVLKAAFGYLWRMYNSWIGAYSTVGVSLHFAIFSEKLYFLCPLIIIVLFLYGAFVLIDLVFHKYFNFNRNQSLFIYFAYVFLSLNLMTSVRQGVYWWNGAAYYTGFYCLMMILWGRVLSLGESSSKKNILLKTIYCCILTFVVQGGNLVTIFLNSLVMIVYCFSIFLRKEKTRYCIFSVALITIVGFCLNAFSPGNMTRVDSQAEIGFVSAIVHAVISSIVSIKEFMTLPLIVMMVPVSAVIYKGIERFNVEIKYPLLFSILTLGLYTAQFCPAWYGHGFEGELRIINLYYFSYVFLLMVNLTYWMGWYKAKFRFRGFNRDFMAYLNNHSVGITGCYIVLFLVSLISLNDSNAFASVATAKIILDGSGARYSAERYEQDRILSDPQNTGKDMVLKGVTVLPYPLAIGSDLLEETDSWNNRVEAAYYGVNSITVTDD